MQRLFIAIVFIASLCLTESAQAAYMSPISDLVSTSNPGVSASHLIIFKVTNAVPASGSISITPESAFSIPGGFSFADVDVAVSSGGPYVERDLAASADAVNDGVFVVTGSTGSITITLNSSTGIAADSMVRIVLGTSATHQGAGTMSPVNPASTGSYRIRVDTHNGGTHIDDAKAMVAIVAPVTTQFEVPYLAPVISDGYPTGTLPAGSNTIELSVMTDKSSTCRYATSSGITYASMTNSFQVINNVLHVVVISGHVDNTSYTYYVRCSDLGGLVNLTDYPISFSLGPVPDVTTSDGNTPSGGSSTGGSGGSGGVGSFSGGSAVLFLSTVTLAGKAPPQTVVTMMRDGKVELTVNAGADGAFTGRISGLERGTYTFITYATDGKGNRTSRFSSTLTLGAGTNNSIANILLSPTVSVPETVEIGDAVSVSGTGIPESTISLTLRNVPKTGPLGTAKEYTASSTSEGTWSFTIPAKDFARGTYEIKAKVITSEASSEYSGPAYVGYGESPSQTADTGNRSDINKDGKVNLVDFSILLTHWNDADEDADINQDGIVNLSDFSILLFNWTG